MRSFFPTRHAAAKMAARDITWTEVLWVLEAPEVTYAATTGPHAGKKSEINQRGNLYVVTATEPRYDFYDRAKEYPMTAVITVGYRNVEQWTDADARNRDKDTTVTTADGDGDEFI